MKETILVANWKLNKTKTEIEGWFDKLGLLTLNPKSPLTVEVCPPLPYLELASLLIGRLHLSTHVKFLLGAQNVSQFDKGEYTGEVSAWQLKDLGVKTVIIGHSERRRFLNETDKEIAQKAANLWNQGLETILCVSQIEQVVSFKNLLPKDHPSTSRLLVAFEPIFAIGSGQADTPKDAQKMALEIKKVLGENIKVLYGGSVNSQNVVDFVSQPNISGCLIGTASLKATEFSKIIKRMALLPNLS